MAHHAIPARARIIVIRDQVGTLLQEEPIKDELSRGDDR
jgi:hypothetical protein